MNPVRNKTKEKPHGCLWQPVSNGVNPVRNKTKEKPYGCLWQPVSNGVNPKQLIKESGKKKTITDDELLDLEAKYCSWGDTVHYAEKLNLFKSAQGSYLYDRQGIEYLDLQMWYSAVNFGYRNKRLNTALKNQIDIPPQLACQYLHEEKIRLAAKLAQKNVFEIRISKSRF